MGETIFSRTASGKDAYEAYDSACAYAAADGEAYSNNGEGFKLVELPQDVKLSTWLCALEEGNLPPTLQMHLEEFTRQFEVYSSKHEPVLCFEIIDKNRKGELKKYIFTGWVPD